MGILRTALISVPIWAACYAPETRDCTIACNAVAQCAGDQVCGSDGFCASPAVAGHCTGVDASTFVSLRIAIEGHGKISIEQIGDCDSDTATEGNCTFTVPPMVARDLKAVENLDHKFLEWTQTCVGTITTCSLTPVMELTQVGAKFE